MRPYLTFILGVWTSVALLVGLLWSIQWLLDEHMWRQVVAKDKAAQAAYAKCQQDVKGRPGGQNWTFCLDPRMTVGYGVPDSYCAFEWSTMTSAHCLTGWHRR